MNPIARWLEDARKKPDTKYVDTCDGIRAIAIMLVAWFHIWQQSWLYPGLDIFGRHISFDPLVRSGYIWVDVMILISGFCLYLPWARRQEAGAPVRTADFYARRLFRIHPTYLLTIIVMFAAALVQGLYYTKAHMYLDLFSHLTYTHTFFYNAYYATNLGGSLWTLAIEMQFYLIFPLLARAFKRMPGTTFAGMVAVALATRGYIAANFEDVSLYFNQLPAYLDTFAFGMAAAAIHVQLSKVRHGAIGRVLCSLACVGICVLFWKVVRGQAASGGTLDIRIGQMNNRMAMSMLGAALLLCSAHAGWLVRRLLCNPVTRFISSVSMQFYIWHQTLAVWLLKWRVVPSEAVNPNYEGDLLWQQRFTLVCFAAGLLLAALLTYGVERPAARFLQRKWDAFRQREKAEKGR